MADATQAIRAITFDVGGTLIEPWPSVGHVYADVAAEQGIRSLAPEILQKRFVAAWKELGECAESREDWAAVVEHVFKGLTTGFDPAALFEALYVRFTEPSVWRVFEDVHPTLQVLCKQGCRLGIISNWDERLGPLLRKLDLHKYFAVAVVSCEVGSRKPERAIFQTAAQALGVDPGEVLHVGDSLKHDVEAARNAGMQAAGICRGGSGTTPGWMRSLSELLAAACAGSR